MSIKGQGQIIVFSLQQMVYELEQSLKGTKKHNEVLRNHYSHGFR